MKTIISNSERETEAAGEALAPRLKKGAVITLEGGLGAGKTCFSRGLLRAFNVKKPVTSPTYTIINQYEGFTPECGTIAIYHIDAYRLKTADDFAETGGEELLYSGGICVIEWPELIASMLPSGVLRVKISVKSSSDNPPKYVRKIVIGVV